MIVCHLILCASRLVWRLHHIFELAVEGEDAEAEAAARAAAGAGTGSEAEAAGTEAAK
jgi:hypothetical protein